jgi:hypothetical protein
MTVKVRAYLALGSCGNPTTRSAEPLDESGKIAIKLINHCGDDVLKVFGS